MDECWTTKIAWNITLRQDKRLKHNSFEVQYGAEVWPKLTYAEATAKLGEAIMHALACEFKLDNERN